MISDLDGEVLQDEVDALETVGRNVDLPAEVDIGLVVGVEPEADLQAGGREVPEAVVQAHVNLEALLGRGRDVALHVLRPKLLLVAGANVFQIPRRAWAYTPEEYLDVVVEHVAGFVVVCS